MTSAIQAFSYNGQEVRKIDRDGEPWFFANDVCRALHIKNARDAVAKLDEDEKGIASTDTLGGEQSLTIVSWPGVYRLVFASRKVEAEKFKRWLAHEVIPAIFKTGRYQHPAADHPPRLPAADEKRARRVRYAKMHLVSVVMRLEELGVDAGAIDMGAVVKFGRQLARL